VRNKVVAHPGYRDTDLDRLYSQVDLMDSANQERFQTLLLRLARASHELAWQLAAETDLPPEHFGFRQRPS
jgi:hypothetical protein